MANFTYGNSVVVSRMFKHLENTMFDGVSVSCNHWSFVQCYKVNSLSQGNKVMFDENGVREIDTIAILQYQLGNVLDITLIIC